MVFEIWKQIPGYEGLYEVSNLGRVKSTKRNGTRGGVRSLQISPAGYPRLTLNNTYKAKVWNIHKLMQLAFDMGEGIVDHINRDRSDNRLENLRIVTARENALNSSSNNKLPGAYHFPRNKKKPWMSKIMIEGKEVYLGYYETAEEASEVYMEKLKTL